MQNALFFFKIYFPFMNQTDYFIKEKLLYPHFQCIAP